MNNPNPRDVFAYMGSAEFAQKCHEVKVMLDENEDALTPAEIADRLGLPLQVLLATAFAWDAAGRGEAIAIGSVVGKPETVN